MRRRVRLLHAADLHIGEHTSEGLDANDRSLLRGVVDLTIEASVDLMIIAGDLFDNNRISVDTAEAAYVELEKAGVPVLVLPGNHDCLTSDSIYFRVKIPGENIRVFLAAEGQTFSFPELTMVVWGKPITGYSGELRPLAGIDLAGADKWRVAVAHGYYAGDSPDKKHSYQISRNDIIESGCDYVALGHWSEFRCICEERATACYSGSAAQTDSVAMVDFGEDGVLVERRFLQRRK